MNLHTQRAFAALELRRWELALAAVEAGLAEQPDCADLFAVAACANAQLNRLDAAHAAAQHVAELEPECDRGFRLLMDIHRRFGNEAVRKRQGRLAWECFAKAVEWGEQAARLNPYCASTLANLSLITRAMGNQHEANELAVRALEADPDDIAALHVYGQSRSNDGDKETAERTVRRALELAPEVALVHRLLGELLLARNDFRGAYNAIRTSLQLDPCHAHTEELYARVLQTQSALVRGLLRLHNYLIVNVFRRAVALAAFMGGTVLLGFVAEAVLPPDFKGAWTLVMFLGFLTLVSVVAEPERIANLIWFFAKWGGSAKQPAYDGDSVSAERHWLQDHDSLT